MTMCSTSAIVPVRLLAGISSARAMVCGNVAASAGAPTSFRNVRRLGVFMVPPPFRWNRLGNGGDHRTTRMSRDGKECATTRQRARATIFRRRYGSVVEPLQGTGTRMMEVWLMSLALRAPSPGDQAHVQDWLRLIRAEYDEIPDLQLTRAQAEQLWGIDTLVADALLGALVA